MKPIILRFRSWFRFCLSIPDNVPIRVSCREKPECLSFSPPYKCRSKIDIDGNVANHGCIPEYWLFNRNGRGFFGPKHYDYHWMLFGKRGGDVIMSFGGEGGKELANVIDAPAQLEAAYQSVIDRYQFTWLDFDIEGDNLDHGKPDSERRNVALANLQRKNPGLIISYTLPVNPDGLSEESCALLADAKGKGVKVRSVDIMVMFFGNKFINLGKSEGQLGIESAIKAREQLQKIDPAMEVGLCPCLGRNGSK